jgi:hypothetical protein
MGREGEKSKAFIVLIMGDKGKWGELGKRTHMGWS